jgi:hypothetical protein
LFVYAKDLFVEASLLTALSALGALVFTALLVPQAAAMSGERL